MLRGGRGGGGTKEGHEPVRAAALKEIPKADHSKVKGSRERAGWRLDGSFHNQAHGTPGPHTMCIAEKCKKVMTRLLLWLHQQRGIEVSEGHLVAVLG